MFFNHEIRYIKRKKRARFLRVDGKSGQIVVNTGYLPNLRKHAKDPSDADIITLRNRAWREKKPPEYINQPKVLETAKDNDKGFWTYWEDNIK